MKKRFVSPNPSPLGRFFPAFEAGERQPTSKDRVQWQSRRRLRVQNPRRRAGFTRAPYNRELRAMMRKHYLTLRRRCLL